MSVSDVPHKSYKGNRNATISMTVYLAESISSISKWQKDIATTSSMCVVICSKETCIRNLGAMDTFDSVLFLSYAREDNVLHQFNAIINELTKLKHWLRCINRVIGVASYETVCFNAFKKMYPHLTTCTYDTVLQQSFDKMDKCKIKVLLPFLFIVRPSQIIVDLPNLHLQQTMLAYLLNLNMNVSHHYNCKIPLQCVQDKNRNELICHSRRCYKKSRHPSWLTFFTDASLRLRVFLTYNKY